MWKSEDTFDAAVQYALRMVTSGCATVEQAASTCGVQPAALRALLEAPRLQTVQESEKQKFFAGMLR